MSRRATLGIAVVFFALAISALIAPRLVTLSRRPPAIPSTPNRVVPPRPSIPDMMSPIGDGDDGAVDLYGNEVTSAVAKYSFDALGSLYELHSPQTEVPKLGPPKS